MMHASAGLESLTGATSVGALRRSRTGHTAPFRIAEEKSAARTAPLVLHLEAAGLPARRPLGRERHSQRCLVTELSARRSVPDLIAAIEEYLVAYNQDPKPFVWTAEVDKIMEKIGRARASLGGAK